MPILFTQYLRPDGRRVPMYADRSERIERKAAELIQAGYAFEAEVLRTDEVSLTCSRDDETVGIELVPTNGPEVSLAVDRLVERIWEHWRKEQTQYER